MARSVTEWRPAPETCRPSNKERDSLVLDAHLMPKQLEAMLARRHPGVTVAVNGYEPVLGGFSRLTGRFDVVIDSEKRTMVVRGDPPAEMATCDTDRGQEWRLMSSLHA